jgi:hypothetical protein
VEHFVIDDAPEFSKEVIDREGELHQQEPATVG